MADFAVDFVVDIEVDFEGTAVGFDLRLKLELDFGKLMGFLVFFEVVTFYLHPISIYLHIYQHKII